LQREQQEKQWLQEQLLKEESHQSRWPRLQRRLNLLPELDLVRDLYQVKDLHRPLLDKLV
jgi:hypothetical protein